MDPASLTVGIVTLAGLFNNAVDCFEYVQLGHNLSTNFQTCLFKLDNARLRLSRWGQSIGLSGNVANLQSLESTALSTDDISKAESLLGQVLKLFADAEGVSLKFKTRVGITDSSLKILDVQADMDSVGRSLHEKMRELSIKRQNGTALRQKVKWALYEEKHFRRLIEDVIALVNNLVEMFPASQALQKKLCVREASEIGTSQGLPILKSIVASQDRDLDAAISNVLESSVSIVSFMSNLVAHLFLGQRQ